VLKSLSAGIVLVTLAAGPALAQDRVTVVMRDGERVTGLFEDRVTEQFYVRSSKEDQRRLLITQVAVIDVAGDGQNLPAAELSMAAGSEHVLVPRSGQPVRGRWMDIAGGPGSAKGDEPRIVYFRTTGGEERRLAMSEVARLYLGNVPATLGSAAPASPGATATPGQLPATGAATVTIPANADWVPTGVMVRRGDRLTFEATGQVTLSADPNDVASPDGSLTGRRATASPMPGTLAGALIGMVGRSPAFAIGTQSTPITAPADGQVFLRVNDDQMNDNTGQFTVTIRRAQQ
jgi:hypothetical protein